MLYEKGVKKKKRKLNRQIKIIYKHINGHTEAHTGERNINYENLCLKLNAENQENNIFLSSVLRTTGKY